MDAKAGGQTESPQAVEVMDEAGLADALKQTLELEEVPKDEQPEEPSAAAGGDEGKEVLSQTEGEEEAEADLDAEGTEETEGAEETGQEAADSDVVDDDAEDGMPRGVQKRIDKLTKRVKERNERISELENKLEEAASLPDTTPAPPPRADNPFTNLSAISDVEREEQNAEAVIDWCDEHPDGAVVDTSDGEVEYTAEEVRSMRRRAGKAIRKWLPERKSWIREHKVQDEYAQQHYKWWSDKSSAQYQAAMNIVREFPEVQRFPDYKIIVGDTLVGMAARLEGEKSSGKKKRAVAPKKAPAQPVAQVSEPAPVDESTARSSSARQRFAQSGDSEDLADIIATDFLR